jgi:hypothetical protein
MIDEKEIYDGVTRILRNKGVSCISYDEHILITNFDGLIVLEDEKLIIYEYYLPWDMNIPTTGERLTTIRLADPDCFDRVRKFCHEQARREKAANKKHS